MKKRPARPRSPSPRQPLAALADGYTELRQHARELADAFFAAAPDREVSREEVEHIAGFVTSRLMEETTSAVSGSARSFVEIGAAAFKEDLERHLTAKLALRDQPTEGRA